MPRVICVTNDGIFSDFKMIFIKKSKIFTFFQNACRPDKYLSFFNKI